MRQQRHPVVPQQIGLHAVFDRRTGETPHVLTGAAHPLKKDVRVAVRQEPHPHLAFDKANKPGRIGQHPSPQHISWNSQIGVGLAGDVEDALLAIGLCDEGEVIWRLALQRDP